MNKARCGKVLKVQELSNGWAPLNVCWRPDGHNAKCIGQKKYQGIASTARKNQDARLKMLADLKVSKGCADCGYNAHPAALDFDHLPGLVKIGNISDPKIFMNDKLLWPEIDKCEVVCANCHRVRTVTRVYDPA